MLNVVMSSREGSNTRVGCRNKVTGQEKSPRIKSWEQDGTEYTCDIKLLVKWVVSVECQYYCLDTLPVTVRLKPGLLYGAQLRLRKSRLSGTCQGEML